MILAIPSNNNAIPRKINNATVVPTGNVRARLAKMIIKIPNPIEAHLDPCGINIPVITRSIPIIRNIIARMTTKVTNVMPGNTIA
jgi:hypothetical protein